MYEIVFAAGVRRDLKRLRPFDRGQVIDEIESQLARSPGKATTKRKVLHNLVPPFEAVPPVWQLRVGDLRVFYDVDEDERMVFVRAVRHKPGHKTTEEIL